MFHIPTHKRMKATLNSGLWNEMRPKKANLCLLLALERENKENEAVRNLRIIEMEMFHSGVTFLEIQSRRCHDPSGMHQEETTTFPELSSRNSTHHFSPTFPFQLHYTYCNEQHPQVLKALSCPKNLTCFLSICIHILSRFLSITSIAHTVIITSRHSWISCLGIISRNFPLSSCSVPSLTPDLVRSQIIKGLIKLL